MEAKITPRLSLVAVCMAAALGGAGCSNAQAPAPSEAAKAAQAPPASITPENDLEAALLKAAVDPKAQPAFEQAFLDAKVFMRTDPERVKEMEAAIGPDGKWRGGDVSFWLLRDEHGDLVVPVFTSAGRLRSVYPGKAWVSLRGREVLKLIGRSPVVLNPALAPQVGWSAADVARIRASDAAASPAS